jgi:hypothetical protein
MAVTQDPLAVAVAQGRGDYVLLLGSGLSMTAGVPRGWDVVKDLARQLADATMPARFPIRSSDTRRTTGERQVTPACWRGSPLN